MTDSDDWENQLDSDNEADKKEEDKKKKFDDEDVVDAETVKKQKEAQQKKEQQEKEAKAKQDNALNNAANKKKNFDELWNERQKDIPGSTKINTEGMTEAQKGFAMQMAAESEMTNDLFGMDDQPKTKEKDWKLNSEKDYKEFGKHTAKILYKGSTPYRTENFFRELCREMPEHLDSKQIGSIVEYMKSVFNQKQKQEKDEKDGKNKKKKKIELKGGGGKGYEFNNNAGMVNDVMGGPAGDDDYGDYGDEEGFRREGEAAYDFM